MYEQHWRYMQRIVQLGDGPNLYARYNTNLSRIDYKGVNLFSDILTHIRDWQVCASIDGTYGVGEYIRTGLKYDEWYDNFKAGVWHAKHKRQMRIDFTLTLPGLWEVPAICLLAEQLGVDILAKVTFAFTPDIAMSPLFLPRKHLDKVVNELLLTTGVHNITMRNMLKSLLERPTFEEQWPEEYAKGRTKGKWRMNNIDHTRGGMQFRDTLRDAEIKEWWDGIL